MFLKYEYIFQCEKIFRSKFWRKNSLLDWCSVHLQHSVIKQVKNDCRENVSRERQRFNTTVILTNISLISNNHKRSKEMSLSNIYSYPSTIKLDTPFHTTHYIHWTITLSNITFSSSVCSVKELNMWHITLSNTQDISDSYRNHLSIYLTIVCLLILPHDQCSRVAIFRTGENKEQKNTLAANNDKAYNPERSEVNNYGF